MINKYAAKKFCNEDISLIENYEKAIADKEQSWDCHHRREMTTPRKQLIEIGEYFNRPASELIFLTHSEHSSLHNTLKFKGKSSWNKGRHLTNEHKQKLSNSHKGKHLSEEHKRKVAESNRGKHRSYETKLKISIAQKGKNRKPLTEEHKQKISKNSTGRCWFNNGIKNVFVRECPEGFVKGRLKKKSDLQT